MNRESFREQLLGVMERKEHWAWPAFTSGRVARERLHFHFEQEYGTYVRDFPILVGRSYIRCPSLRFAAAWGKSLKEEPAGSSQDNLIPSFFSSTRVDWAWICADFKISNSCRRRSVTVNSSMRRPSLSAGISRRRSSPSSSKDRARNAPRSVGPIATRRPWRSIRW